MISKQEIEKKTKILFGIYPLTSKECGIQPFVTENYLLFISRLRTPDQIDWVPCVPPIKSIYLCPFKISQGEVSEWLKEHPDSDREKVCIRDGVVD